ncbi:hypothetical protein CDAR_128601 [Caerostris darwini]|uniref:Uncharacterized protein n=1 Tax=Caerostris darwini TaxID=1538125 RepID=A0AAV4NFS4_9ARAC|nr:hypothetical protein CDAR_128601 [Caerostris darwini]
MRQGTFQWKQLKFPSLIFQISKAVLRRNPISLEHSPRHVLKLPLSLYGASNVETTYRIPKYLCQITSHIIQPKETNKIPSLIFQISKAVLHGNRISSEHSPRHVLKLPLSLNGASNVETTYRIPNVKLRYRNEFLPSIRSSYLINGTTRSIRLLSNVFRIAKVSVEFAFISRPLSGQP